MQLHYYTNVAIALTEQAYSALKTAALTTIEYGRQFRGSKAWALIAAVSLLIGMLVLHFTIVAWETGYCQLRQFVIEQYADSNFHTAWKKPQSDILKEFTPEQVLIFVAAAILMTADEEDDKNLGSLFCQQGSPPTTA